MDLHLRPYLPGNGKHTGIRQNQAITSLRLHIPKLPKVITGAFQILVMSQNIGGDINLHPMGMCKSNSLRHLLRRKIFRLSPQSKGFTADINCICSKDHCGTQHLQTPRRNQQLRFFHLLPFHFPHPSFLYVCYDPFLSRSPFGKPSHTPPFSHSLVVSVTPSPTGRITVSNSGLCFSS